VQLQWLLSVFGGYDAARYVHFFAMATNRSFIVDARDPWPAGAESLRAMVTGK